MTESWCQKTLIDGVTIQQTGWRKTFSALPRRERPSSVVRQHQNKSSRPPNPLRPSTFTPKVTHQFSRNYYSTPKHTSYNTNASADKNDTYFGRGYGYSPTRRVPEQRSSTQGRWPTRIVPNSGNSHHRLPSNRYYAYNTNVSPNGTNGDSRWSHATPRPNNNVPPSSLTTPELIISTMVPVPDELPLSLAIMVGEDTGVDVSGWKSKMKQVNPLEPFLFVFSLRDQSSNDHSGKQQFSTECQYPSSSTPPLQPLKSHLELVTFQKCEEPQTPQDIPVVVAKKNKLPLL
ncbi:uncharacterized protein CEXT_189701 [Caerostris extrusa]|uniref:Uncharacterized protein n=1 Tax=Caerostris extrusa TaxID=172846 RepID=A0AAV4XVR2_CAEEX|nr:uncharacterized protein CEXT_189701 [Caerostris extrusa]